MSNPRRKIEKKGVKSLIYDVRFKKQELYVKSTAQDSKKKT